jgi:acyl-CoA synthetase (AMP-forming)/AMP-acid ligase II
MERLVECLRRHAGVTPAADALIDGTRRVSYAELYTLAASIAAGLAAAGVRPGDRVASLFPHGPEAVAAIYGTWLAGAVSVPLNPLARAHELAIAVAHAEARVLLHEPGQREVSALANEPGLGQTRILPLDELSGLAAGTEPGLQTPPGAAADELAMLIYTSGTTGRPKGVCLTHANLAANTRAIVRYLGLTARDRVLSVLPFNYAYGNSVLHTHLAVGASIVLEKNLVFPRAVVETMQRERVTGFSGVPSTFALLLSRGNLDETRLDALRYVTQAGAAMAPGMIEKLVAALPGVGIYVMYGQTEATARLTYLPPARLHDKLGSAGIPVDGVELQVRDGQGRVLPAGEQGEVWARGPNVMRGYWRDEAATRNVLHEGWLRTGDFGQLDAEGFLFLAGRRSDIIKTGAHRVHPLEVEEAICTLPGVIEVAVTGVEDEILGQAITAFVVADPATPLTIERVKARCKELLASYKIPKHVEFRASLPRTSSGKVRRMDLSILSAEGSA